MKKTGVMGALIASVVALMFIANSARADENGAAKAGAKAAAGQAVKVKCVGGNDCKGKGACSGGGHDCQGQNSCKGKGWIESSSAKECLAKGGKPETIK